MKTVDLDEIMAWEREYRRAFVNTLSGIKAAFLLGTQEENGRNNLGLFASIVHLGAAPPLLGVVLRPPDAQQDTRRIIQINTHFTLNAVSVDQIESAHQCSARYPPDRSEFDACHCTPWFSERHIAPYVGESPLKIGLKAIEIIDVKANNSRMVVAAITEVHLEDKLLGIDGQILPAAAQLCGVVGLNAWHSHHPTKNIPFARVL